MTFMNYIIPPNIPFIYIIPQLFYVCFFNPTGL